MKKLIGLMTLVLLAAVAVRAGEGCCDKKDKADCKPQVTCPIMGEPVKKNIFVDVKGFRVYVCCEACKAAVEADPDAALARIKANGETVACTPRAAGDKDNCSTDKAACTAKDKAGCCTVKSKTAGEKKGFRLFGKKAKK